MSSEEKVVALYDYSSQNDDELSFEEGDEITVLGKEQLLWWSGELNGRVGLFPYNYVAEKGINDSFDSDDGDPEDAEREQHIEELINTEQNYVDDLSIASNVFKKTITYSLMLTNEQLNILFNNWDEILERNSRMLRVLHIRKAANRGGTATIVGDILYGNLPGMDVYVENCGWQMQALDLLETLTEKKKEFSELVKRCESDPRTKGLPLASFLIKPMQRVTKYPLLIKKILEHTPENHPDRQKLKQALQRAQDLCQQINEVLREKENVEKLGWLQDHVLIDEPLVFDSETHHLGPRKFLHHGALKKTRSGKELVGFLTNDFLLFTQPTRPLGEPFSFVKSQNIFFRIYKQPLLLSNLTILGSVGCDSGDEFQIEYDRVIYHLSATSCNEKNLWLKKLFTAKNEVKKIELVNLKRCQSPTRRRPKGMLKLVVVYGLDLKILYHNFDYEVFCEAKLGSQKCSTLPVSTPSASNPTWQTAMRFLIKDIEEDVLCLTVKCKAVFSPDKFLGFTKVPVTEILSTIRKYGDGPVVKVLKLQKVHSGKVTIMFDVHLFKHV